MLLTMSSFFVFTRLCDQHEGYLHAPMSSLLGRAQHGLTAHAKVTSGSKVGLVGALGMACGIVEAFKRKICHCWVTVKALDHAFDRPRRATINTC